MPFPDEKRRLLLLSIGSHQKKRPLSPTEVAEFLRQWLNSGVSLQSIAEQAQLEGTEMLNRFLKLEKLTKDLRPLVDWGSGKTTLGPTTAARIASLPTAQEQLELGTAVISNRLNKAEVESILQRVGRGRVPLASAIAEILKLRPQIEKRFVYIGTLDARLSPQLEGWLYADRDRLLKSAVSKLLEGYSDFGGRLTTDRFTLVGGEEFNRKLQAFSNDFETRVNDSIAGSLKP